MKNFFQFLNEATESQASMQAKKLNLKSDGHGGWLDTRGKFVAKTEDGKLKFLSKREAKQEEQGQKQTARPQPTAAAKPKAKLTTPSSAAIKALKKFNVKKIAIFTPYSKKLNDEVVNYFIKEGFNVTSNSYLDIKADYDIGKVEQEFLYNTLSQIEMNDAEALFISCTALPVLNIIDKLEKKLNKPVLSSNQALIWDSLESIGNNKSVIGFGKLFNIN